MSATAGVPASTAMTRLKVTQLRVVRAEWIKLRSLRSTWLALSIGVLLMIGLGAAFSAATATHWHQMRLTDRLTFDPTATSLGGIYLAQLAIGVLGVLYITGEYATGLIRSTFAAVPRRLPVLWGKSVVFAAFSFVVMLPTAVIAFRLGQLLLSSTAGVPYTSLGSPGVTRAVIGAAIYVAAIGLFGVALGTLIRNTAGTIATMFGILLVLPIIVHFLPTGWFDAVNPYLPSNAGLALMTVRQAPQTLAPWAGFGVFCGYVFIAYLLAVVSLLRRDA